MSDQKLKLGKYLPNPVIYHRDKRENSTLLETFWQDEDNNLYRFGTTGYDQLSDVPDWEFELGITPVNTPEDALVHGAAGMIEFEYEGETLTLNDWITKIIRGLGYFKENSHDAPN